MKCNQSSQGFELGSPCPFPTTITITPRAPPSRIWIMGSKSSKAEQPMTYQRKIAHVWNTRIAPLSNHLIPRFFFLNNLTVKFSSKIQFHFVSLLIDKLWHYWKIRLNLPCFHCCKSVYDVIKSFFNFFSFFTQQSLPWPMEGLKSESISSNLLNEINGYLIVFYGISTLVSYLIPSLGYIYIYIYIYI